MTGRCETTVEEPLQQLADGQPRTGGGELDPVHAVAVDQLPASTLRVLGVAMHREGSLHASTVHLVEADHDADLPHPRRTLTDRTGAPLRPGRGDRGIPIRRGHPYSYRDSYRDGPPAEAPHLWKPAAELPIRRSEGLEPPTF
jgi:hypothetical protein